MKSIALIISLLMTNIPVKKDSANYHFKDNPSSGPQLEVISGTELKKDNLGNEIYAHLNLKQFDSSMFFNKMHFPNPVNFCASEFKNDVTFSGAKFDCFVDFSGATFKRDIDFSNCEFHKFLFMSGIYTDTLTAFNFYNATFPALIDFSHNANLHNVVDFTNADFDSLSIKRTLSSDTRHFINIYNTDISKIKIGYQHFRMCFYDPQQKDKTIADYLNSLKKTYGAEKTVNGKTMLETFIASSTYKDYISSVFPSTSFQDTLIQNFTHFYFGSGFPSRLFPDQIDALYSRLLKNFDDNGQMDSYKLLDIDYQDYRWSTKPIIISWLYIFPKYWNFYGNETECILGWTPLLLILLTLITFLSYDHVFSETNRNKVTYHLENIPKIDSSTKWPNYYKFKNSFIFTSVIFFSFNLKTEKLDFKKPSFFYIVIINILGLLCLAYLANYILQK